MTFELVIDSRETDPEVFRSFERLQLEKEFTFRRELLPVGDVVCGDICIERKAAGDFIGSIAVRLPEQLAKMSLNYEHKYVIIEGNPFGVQTAMNVRSIIGMMASMAVRHNVKIIPVHNTDGFAWACWTIVNKHLDGKTFVPSDHRILKYRMSAQDVAVSAVSMIPGIGHGKAEVILKEYDYQLGKLIQASMEDLTKIKGIGDEIARKVKEHFYMPTNEVKIIKKSYPGMKGAEGTESDPWLG